MDYSLADVLDHKGRKAHSIRPECSVLDAVTLMNEHAVGSLLVMDDDDLVGIITERDILRRIVAAGRAPRYTKVRTVMSRRPLVVAPDTTVGDAMRLMARHQRRHLPVVQDGSLAGLVSMRDLNSWVTRERQRDVSTLLDYIAGPHAQPSYGDH